MERGSSKQHRGHHHPPTAYKADVVSRALKRNPSAPTYPHYHSSAPGQARFTSPSPAAFSSSASSLDRYYSNGDQGLYGEVSACSDVPQREISGESQAHGTYSCQNCPVQGRPLGGGGCVEGSAGPIAQR